MEVVDPTDTIFDINEPQHHKYEPRGSDKTMRLVRSNMFFWALRVLRYSLRFAYMQQEVIQAALVLSEEENRLIDEDLVLLKQKGIYLYEYMDSFERA